MGDWKPIRKDGKRECPVCTNSYRALGNGDHAVAAHFDYSVRPRRWCPGGAPPKDPARRGLPAGVHRPR